LGRIEQDGTFDQLRPVQDLLARLNNQSYIASFDLSAATDRLPIKFQTDLLSLFINREFAEAWANLLVQRE